MTVHYLSGGGAFASFGDYSALSRGPATGEIVAIAGQLGTDSSGALTGAGDAAAQTRQAFHNIGTALSQVGLGFADVLKFTTFVVGRDTIAEFKSARKDVFAEAYPDGQYPPNTLLVVSGLVEERFVVEIEAIALGP